MRLQQLGHRRCAFLSRPLSLDGGHVPRRVVSIAQIKQAGDLGRIQHSVPDRHVIQIAGEAVARKMDADAASIDQDQPV